MSFRYIWKKNRKYYLWDSFTTWEAAHKIAKYHRKKNKSRYFIIKSETGYLIPQIRYHLYMDKAFKIF